MADRPITGLTEFTPTGRLLIPVVDPQASFGLKNGYITLEALQTFLGTSSSSGSGSSGSSGSSSGAILFDFSDADNSGCIAYF